MKAEGSFVDMYAPQGRLKIWNGGTGVCAAKKDQDKGGKDVGILITWGH